MNPSRKPSRGESPDSQSLPIRDEPTIDQDAADTQADPDVRANSQAGSNGPIDGLAMAGANVADPYNLASLRLTQDFASAVGVKKLVTTVPIKKPSKEWFVRTHTSPDYRLETAVLELKEDRETYLVVPGLWPGLASDPTFSPRLLVTTVNRQGVLFLWPIRLPETDGKLDDWSRSAMDAANEAKTRWVRITANMSLGAYEVAVASGQVAEPEWPDISFQEIIRIAFRDKMIDDWNHPVLRRLRGEI